MKFNIAISVNFDIHQKFF